MERKFNFSVDEYYHVFSRGVDRREIFSDKEDRERFLRLLYITNSSKSVRFTEISRLPYPLMERGEPLAAVGAYCLMPNHFHLLLRETEENGISSFMKKLLTSYSMYFNKKNDRTGNLFESTFRAEHVDGDNYLKYLFAYIHLNPIKLIDSEWKKKGIINKKLAKEYLSSYEYSSYFEYTGKERDESLILCAKEFPEYFGNIHDFRDFINYWLTYRKEVDSIIQG
ncbi:MAG: transposase [Candidatus Paceibacterota bacterium]|jgi:REP element-mobilizing transposase RayT|nr:transposase [Candidatus Paceibacterota bacterium]